MGTDHSTLTGVSVVARAAAVALLSGALSSGCSPTPAPDAARPSTAERPTPAAAEAPAVPAAAAGQGTVGGDGSQIRLDPLTSDDLAAADLSGELACGFSVQEDASPILYAMGIVASDEPTQGVVKVSGYVETVHAPGGFDGMAAGAAFAGRGKTVHVAVTGPATAGGESPPRPATLTYQRADGASRVFEGRWRCGP